MNDITKATEKQETVTGGDVNYYLVVMAKTLGLSNVVAEIEDIIEALNMTYAAGCVFKAVVRLCKLRQDLGKPGSTALYEAEKNLYYAFRTLVVSQRRQRSMGKLRTSLQHLVSTLWNKDLPTVLTITDPKRLTPYSFGILDFVDALKPTAHEADVLVGIINISYMRLDWGYGIKRELEVARNLVYYAERIEHREAIASGKRKLS